MSEQWNVLLYEKAKKEYEEFLKSLLDLPKEELVIRSYEKVYKEEFVSILENNVFSEDEAKALCELEYPLDALYQEWISNDYSCVTFIEQTIHDLADEFM